MFKKIVNKDHKSLLENFFSLSSLQLIGLVLPLITLPYILRTIGLEKYGIIILSWSLVNYFVPLTDFSFRITATRDVAVFKNSPLKLNIIYSKVMILQTALQAASYVVILCIVFLYRPFYEERIIFWLTMPYLLGNTIFPDWFFQGMEKMKYITVINLGVKLFFTLCVFLFIKQSSDYWIYPLLQTSGFLAAGLAGQFILIKKYKIRFIWVGWKSIKKTFRSNIPIFINQFLPTLYNNTSIFLLGILTNNSLVGIYDAIRKVINLGVTAIDLISKVFFPFINRKRNAFNKYKKLMLCIGAVLTLGPIIFYKVILWYLHIEYEYAFATVAILSVGLFFLTLYNVFGLNYFIVHRMDKVVMRNTIAASVIGFLLSYPLIHNWSIIGAAINLTGARMIMGGGLFIKYLQVKNTVKND